MSTIGEAPVAELQQLTPGYFETMDLSLLDGRFLDRADVAGTHMITVVNETFAQLHWPGESAVGRRTKLYSSRLPWIDIVGVVKNERHDGLASVVRPKMYIPHAQASVSAYSANATMNLVVHGEGIERLARPIRTIVNTLNSAAPVYHVQTMENVKSAAMVDRSYPTLLLTIFGLLALFLASVGIYGLVAFQVSQGKHAIGVHVALGATASNIRRMVVGNGLVPVIAGVAIGLTGAFGLTRLLGSLLYEVSPVDPSVYLGVSAVLVLVAATASLVPAMKATRIDPVEVLRSE
ncbi:FtsX-like permease family protein [Gemmatimonadota bacterium]